MPLGKIGAGFIHKLKTVFHAADSVVALIAKKSADFPGGVAVIDVKVPNSDIPVSVRGASADITDTSLCIEHGLVVIGRDAVIVLQHSGLSLSDQTFAGSRFVNSDLARSGSIVRDSITLGGAFWASANMQAHSFEIERFATILTGVKYPSAWSRLRTCSLPSSSRLSPCKIIIDSALLARMRLVGVISAGREIVKGLNGLASGTYLLSIQQARLALALFSNVLLEVHTGNRELTKTTRNVFGQPHRAPILASLLSVFNGGMSMKGSVAAIVAI